MTWKPELDELARREAFARAMGGADKVKRQHDQGRLTVRERIDKLIDQKSFHEVGAISGIAEYETDGELKSLTPANCVFGRGKMDGRPVVVVGDDFTVRGGSADASISAKPLMAEQMAHDFRLPIIRVIEGSGGGGSVKTIETKGAANLPGGVGGTEWYWYTTANMAHVPVVGLGLGSVAGLGAARLAASHYSVMTKSSAMFVAGPPVVARLGQSLDKQELGGWQIQTKAGAVDHAVDTEDEAFACARRFLSYLPSSVYELPPTIACNDDPEREDESLLSIVPRNRRQIYKMRPIIESVVDRGSFFEMSQNFGRSIIAGLARLQGRAVLILASDHKTKMNWGDVLSKQKRLTRLLGALACLYACCCLAEQPAYADVSLSSIGMGHGAPDKATFIQFMDAVKKYNASGERFRIDTHCPSACTMFLSVRNVCITPDATLAFHAGGNMKTGVFNPRSTAVMLRAYKPALRQYLTSNHYMDTFAFHTISGEDLIKRFRYPACR